MCTSFPCQTVVNLNIFPTPSVLVFPNKANFPVTGNREPRHSLSPFYNKQTARTRDHPSHSQTSRLLSSSLSLGIPFPSST